MKNKFLFLLIILIVSLCPAVGSTQEIETDLQATTSTSGLNFSPSAYNLITPIGNISQVKDQDAGGLSTFFNLIIKIAIALAGAIAVVVIIVNGVQYMVSGNPWEKGENKLNMWTAIGGIALLLCSYIILYTINPDLVNIKIGIDKGAEGEWQLSAGDQYRLSQNSIKTFSRTKYYDTIKAAVAASSFPGHGTKINHCLVQVAVLRETNGNESLIGHDENAPSNGIPSRKAFVTSGKKSNGEVFAAGIHLTTDNTFLNNDHSSGNIYSAIRPSTEDLGLDWRFSHGIGLMQVTFYPKGSAYAPYDKGTQTLITKTSIKPKDMLDPNKAIKAGIEHLQHDFYKCKGDILNTYRAYGTGDCNSTNPFINTEAPLRKNLYDQCIAQDK